MRSKEKNNLIFLRLFSGEDIYKELEEACKVHKVQTGVILSGVGQLKDFMLGYFKGKGDYAPQEFHKPHELLSLTGNAIKQDKKYKFHLHAVLGNENKKTFGGHLIEGNVETTNEIVMLKNKIKLERKFVKETGIDELFLE